MNGVIIGVRRQGKSTLAAYLSQRKKAVVIFDPNVNFPAFPHLSLDELQLWFEAGSTGVVVFRPDPSRISDDFAALSITLWPYGYFSFVIDEAHLLQRPQSMHPELQRWIRQGPREDSHDSRGRSLDVDIIQTSHRIVDINCDGRSLWSDVFIFRTIHPADLERIERDFGSGVSNAVTQLERFHFVHWWLDSGGIERWSIHIDPAAWYCNIRGSDCAVLSNKMEMTEAVEVR